MRKLTELTTSALLMTVANIALAADHNPASDAVIGPIGLTPQGATDVTKQCDTRLAAIKSQQAGLEAMPAGTDPAVLLAAYDDVYNGLVVDTGEGDRLARVLGSKRVLFLANHGIIVVGETVAEAFDAMYYLERACRLQVLARSMGGKLRQVRPEVARDTYRLILADTPKYAGAHFTALKRILDREEAGYSR